MEFAEALNELRQGQCSGSTLSMLQSRFCNPPQIEEVSPLVHLRARRFEADTINDQFQSQHAEKEELYSKPK